MSDIAYGIFTSRLIRRCALLATATALASMCALPLAHAGAAFTDSPCLTLDVASSAQECEALARKVSHDITAVRALGNTLENGGRYRDAVTTYQIGLIAHPNHRDLLQRLIRARAQTRSASLLLSPQPDGERARMPEQPPQREKSAPSVAEVKPLQSPAAAATKVANDSGDSDVAAIGHSNDSGGRNLALVIGNESYRDFTPLRSPIADAHALSSLLVREYGFNVSVLTNATRYQIVSALSRLRQEARENDSVLIYYAGHGYLDDATARGYWLPIDAERDNVANWLSTSDITDMLAGLQARHALILADSCFSGTLLRSDPTVTIDERGALLRKLSSRRSRTIMTSGGLEPVVDGGASSHSVFADAVLRALRDNRQQLEAGRLFMQIRERVAMGAEQTPQYAPLRSAGHDGGDFIFSRPSRSSR